MWHIIFGSKSFYHTRNFIHIYTTTLELKTFFCLIFLELLQQQILVLTVDPFLRVQLQHTDFELEVSGDELVQGDHKTMGYT